MENFLFIILIIIAILLLSHRLQLNEHRRELAKLDKKFNSLFDSRPSKVDVQTLELERKDCYMGWYDTTKHVSNEYFFTESNPIMVKYKVLRVKAKKECILHFNTDATVLFEGQDVTYSSIRMKKDQWVSFHGKDEKSNVSIRVYDTPYIEQ